MERGVLKAFVGADARHMPPRRKRIYLTVLFALVWVSAVGSGLGMLLNYESTPGSVATPPDSWPADSKVSRLADRATLVMAAHPHCPCTKASMAELAQIMADGQGQVSAHVLFLKPRDAGPDWEDSPLRNDAAAIPGVTVMSDVDGAEARRFGAETSGQTLLFAADGRRLFTGGITHARGHAGANSGETAILALINGRPANVTRTQVFGCSFGARSES